MRTGDGEPNYDGWKSNATMGQQVPDTRNQMCPECLTIGKWKYRGDEDKGDRDTVNIVSKFECQGTYFDGFICEHVLLVK